MNPRNDAIPKHEWYRIAHSVPPPGQIVLAHAVLSNSDGHVLCVHNKSEWLPNGDIKPEGWGMVTGKVEGRTPIDAIKTEVREESGIQEISFSLEERFLVSVYRDRNGRTHVVFAGMVDSFTEIPKEIKDPDGDIIEAKMVDPRRISNAGYPPTLDGVMFYPMHSKMIQDALGLRRQ